MIKLTTEIPEAGERKVKGYAGKLINLTIEKQYSDESLWKETVNQFRQKSGSPAGDWRGEYWGKLMRGACLTYSATGNNKLYSVITASVKDMLTAADADGWEAVFYLLLACAGACCLIAAIKIIFSHRKKRKG